MPLLPSPLGPLPEGEGNIVPLMRYDWIEKGGVPLPPGEGSRVREDF
jgi:hypothetical protein